MNKPILYLKWSERDNVEAILHKSRDYVLSISEKHERAVYDVIYSHIDEYASNSTFEEFIKELVKFFNIEWSY